MMTMILIMIVMIYLRRHFQCVHRALLNLPREVVNKAKKWKNACLMGCSSAQCLAEDDMLFMVAPPSSAYNDSMWPQLTLSLITGSCSITHGLLDYYVYS